MGVVPFHTFGPDHLLTLTSVFFLCLFFSWLGHINKAPFLDKLIRFSLAILLIGNDIFTQIHEVDLGDWRLSWSLPLQLCDLSLYAVAISLIWKRQIIWELAYYWGLGGSFLATLTPDLPVSFPNFYFISFFIQHGGILAGVLYLTLSHRFPLPFASIKRVWIITNGYTLLIAGFNYIMDTNYLFICQKPVHASILNFFGPWPLYVLGMEVLFTLSLFILYRLYRSLN